MLNEDTRFQGCVCLFVCFTAISIWEFMYFAISTSRNEIVENLLKPNDQGNVNEGNLKSPIAQLNNQEIKQLLEALVRYLKSSGSQDLKWQDLVGLLIQDEGIAKALTRVLSSEPEKYR